MVLVLVSRLGVSVSVVKIDCNVHCWLTIRKYIQKMCCRQNKQIHNYIQIVVGVFFLNARLDAVSNVLV